MEFEIKLDYTIDDIQAYWKSFVQKKPDQKRPETASPKQMRWIGVFFLAAGLLTAVMLSVGMGILEIVLGAVLVFGSWRAARPANPACSRWTRKVWKQHQKTGPLYNCCFTEDGVWVHDSRSDHRYDYAALEALWEDEDYFYLVLSTAQGSYILRKTAFVRGRPEDLPAYWQTQTGKAVQQVRL